MTVPCRRFARALLLSAVVHLVTSAAGTAAASWRESPLWRQLGNATSASPALTVPQADGFACEQPYGERVDFHVIIPMVDRRSYERLNHLGMLGLTGAQVFIYLRTDPGDNRQVAIRLPCNMTLHERILVPNMGDESAAVLAHVALNYDSLPDAVALLHGGYLHSWHAKCSVALRRLRAFYRGLGAGQAATPAMRAFAARAQTINSCTRGGGWYRDCCGALVCRVKASPSYEEGCPWETMGFVNVTRNGVYMTQPLCQLRDRTADTNWTVLGDDVPEFFARQSEILQQYESDPQQSVPVTHTLSHPSPASDSRAVIDPAALAPAAAPSGATDRGGRHAMRIAVAQQNLAGARDAAAAPGSASQPAAQSMSDRSRQERWVVASNKGSLSQLVARWERYSRAGDGGVLELHRHHGHGVLMERLMRQRGESGHRDTSTASVSGKAWHGVERGARAAASSGSTDGSREMRSAGSAEADRRLFPLGEGVARIAQSLGPGERPRDGRAATEAVASSSLATASAETVASRSDDRPVLENAKDELFPTSRERDLVPSIRGVDQSRGNNAGILDPMRLWRPYIRAHGILERWNRPRRSGEWDQNWGSLQPIVPRHLLQSLPKEWWEDVTFLILHVGWRDRDFWTTAWGMMFEWHFWPMIDQRRVTAEQLRVYVDIDREMGEDLAVATCSEGIRTAKPN